MLQRFAGDGIDNNCNGSGDEISGDDYADVDGINLEMLMFRRWHVLSPQVMQPIRRIAMTTMLL
jgi:hypothetical protein